MPSDMSGASVPQPARHGERSRRQEALVGAAKGVALLGICVGAVLATRELIDALPSDQVTYGHVLLTSLTLPVLVKFAELGFKMSRVLRTPLHRLSDEQFFEAALFSALLGVLAFAGAWLGKRALGPAEASGTPPPSFALIRAPSPGLVHVPLAYFPLGAASDCNIVGGTSIAEQDRQRIEQLAVRLQGCLPLEAQVDVWVSGLSSAEPFAAEAQSACPTDLNVALAARRGDLAAGALRDALSAADRLRLGRVSVAIERAGDSAQLAKKRDHFLAFATGIDGAHRHALGRSAIASFTLPAGCDLVRFSWPAHSGAPTLPGHALSSAASGTTSARP